MELRTDPFVFRNMLSMKKWCAGTQVSPSTIPIWFIPSLVSGGRGSRVKARWGGGGRVWSVVQSGRGVRWVRPGSHRGGGVHGGAVEHRGREENRQLTLVVAVVVDAGRPAVRSSHLPLHLHCGLPSRSLTTAAIQWPTRPTDRPTATGINVGSDNATTAAPAAAAAAARALERRRSSGQKRLFVRGGVGVVRGGGGGWKVGVGRHRESGGLRRSGPPRHCRLLRRHPRHTALLLLSWPLSLSLPLPTVLSCGRPHALTASIRPQRPTQNGGREQKPRRRRRCRKHHVVTEAAAATTATQSALLSTRSPANRAAVRRPRGLRGRRDVGRAERETGGGREARVAGTA